MLLNKNCAIRTNLSKCAAPVLQNIPGVTWINFQVKLIPHSHPPKKINEKLKEKTVLIERPVLSYDHAIALHTALPLTYQTLFFYRRLYHSKTCLPIFRFVVMVFGSSSKVILRFPRQEKMWIATSRGISGSGKRSLNSLLKHCLFLWYVT